MLISTTSRGSLWASLSFFFCIIASPVFASAPVDKLLELASTNKLHQKPIWQALLHAKDGRANIFDETFLLSSADFSLQNELYQSIELLFSESTSRSARCRFPARYLWLVKEFSLKPQDFSICAGLTEFSVRAPIDDISLVYASENLASPSSMMGHIFLKISGLAEQGHKLNHSLSFFTEIDGINVPKILIDSLLLGKEGYFALQPYAESEQYYLNAEQRNIWEYQIALSDWELALFRAHVWELKQTELSYFFDSYNCATFSYYLLSVVKPELINFIGSNVSPLDVAKRVNEQGLVKNTLIRPSEKWRTRVLQGLVPQKASNALQLAVDTDSLALWIKQADTPQSRYLYTELADSYSRFRYQSGDLSSEQNQSAFADIKHVRESLEESFQLDVSDYKNPLKSPADSQIFAGYRHNKGQDYVQFGWLPVARKLEDDSRQYDSESELRLFDLSLLYALDTERLKVDEFRLYSVSAFVPRDTLTGGISGRFLLGARQHYDENLNRALRFELSGGLGHSYQLSADILAYGVLGLGLGMEAGDPYLYSQPEVGFAINEVFDMKSLLSVSTVYNQRGSRKSDYRFDFTQSFYLRKDLGTFFAYHRIWKNGLEKETFDFTLKYYY